MSKAREQVISDDSNSPDTMVPTTVPSDRDIERNSVIHPDPFCFRNGLKNDGQLAEFRRRRKTGKSIERYHRRQNNLIAYLLKPMEDHTQEARADDNLARLPVKFAIWASLIANFCLCCLQLYGALSSLSLSLLTTAIDAIFDFGSNVLLFYLHKKASRLDVNKWPVGGARLATIGNIVYGFLMGSANVVVIVESIRALLTHTGGDLKTFHIPSIIAVGVAFGIKLLLFLYCSSLRKKSSQVEVLWEDHRNDLFVNGFGILMSAGGSKLRWYLDPIGAIIIAVAVMFLWGRSVYSQFELLAGKSAPHDFLQLIIYKATTFSDEIDKIDTVRAYHSGPDYFVEVDIVMDAHTPLGKAHDIAQQLQDRIEVLPNVERAFVHIDHETTHIPEHRKL